MKKITFIIISLCYLLLSCNKEVSTNKEKEMLEKDLNKYVPTNLNYDENLLNEKQKIVIEKLYKAGKIIDELFLQQVYYKNDEIEKQLTKSSDEIDKLKYELFKINFGPFDRLNHNKPFIGNEKKPLGANFYPTDLTKEEFNEWIKNNHKDEKAFTAEFTVIKREEESLKAVPYSIEYKDKLDKIAKLLLEAAENAENPSLKKYLTLRAKAFSTNDYFESDMAWMDLKDHTIEVIIGPYEVYEDAMFNYKASFECFITIVDPQESAKLKKFASYLTEIEKNLPYPDKDKNFKRGGESPIVVVQEVFSAGDTKAGVQTLAFNLPNDERVRKAKGSKKVMLKNVHEAKFEKLLKPISKIVLPEEQQKYVTFGGFFNHTLMHEISHGVGPGFIKKDGKDTEVKKELKETYSKIEECKADVLGMFNNVFMIEKGIYPKEVEKEMWVTFLAGIFRSVRFGINEAHGGGNAIIYNFLLEKGAYQFDEKTEKVSVNFDKIYDGIKELANKLLVIQAEGNYEGAKEVIAKYGVESSSIKKLRAKLTELPVDIRPVFGIETAMEAKK